MNNIADEILKTIKYAVDRKAINCDRTYKTVIRKIVKKGYVIIDETGSERTVKCCIPDLNLRVGQAVYVKMVQGRLKDMHICGVA